MAKYIIEKSGPVHGTVEISGAKNAVLPILAATLLTDDPCEISDVPALSDVEVMVKLLESIGSRVSWDYKNKIITVESGKSLRNEAPRELVSLMRGSIFAMGPLLARTGRAMFPLPGGCAIGARPVDLHKKGFEALKATVEMGDDYIEARARELIGGHVYLDFPSVGATENIMMAATLAEGTTVIENAAEEPEITDLAVFLNKMGAKIKGAGSAMIRIEGVDSLHGTKHTVIPDRIETGSFMLAAAITKGELLLTNVVPDHVSAVMSKLTECGVTFEENDEGLIVRGDVNPLVATDIKTMPYPGFPTDLQSQFMSLLTVVRGHSTVTETIFEGRFKHIGELNRMGADIRIEDRKAEVEGGQPLHGAKIRATDLRAGVALVLAALVAEGETEISDIHFVERGYEEFTQKMSRIGAIIRRVDD